MQLCTIRHFIEELIMTLHEKVKSHQSGIKMKDYDLFGEYSNMSHISVLGNVV